MRENVMKSKVKSQKSIFQYKSCKIFICTFEFCILNFKLLFSAKKMGGFTLLEIVVTMGILGLIMLGVGMFQVNIFRYHTALSNQLNSQQESRRTIEQIIAELRAASYAGNGAYPFETASAATLIFFTNTDTDSDIERVRYFMSGSDLQRGVKEPVGSNPILYTGPETITTQIKNVVNGGTPLFSYFNDSYTGSGSPLTSPINVNEVRYVRLTLLVDKDPNRPLATIAVEGGTSVRNLKDNL